MEVFDSGGGVVAGEGGGGSRRVRGMVAVRGCSGGVTRVHFLFLEGGEFGFEETVFAAEFGYFWGGGEGAGDAVGLNG